MSKLTIVWLAIITCSVISFFRGDIVTGYSFMAASFVVNAIEYAVRDIKSFIERELRKQK